MFVPVIPETILSILSTLKCRLVQINYMATLLLGDTTARSLDAREISRSSAFCLLISLPRAILKEVAIKYKHSWSDTLRILNCEQVTTIWKVLTIIFNSWCRGAYDHKGAEV